MDSTTSSLIVLAGVLLPGWLSVSISSRYDARDSEASSLDRWAEFAYHSAIIHTVSILAFIAAVLVFPGYFVGELDVKQIIPLGFDGFLEAHPETGFLLFFGYAVWLVSCRTSNIA